MLALACALVCAGRGTAATPEAELAQKYAPVVRQELQEKECGPGEPYQPSDIDAFLDDDTVALRGPWRSNDLIKVAPTAADLGRGLYGYNLDFPGNPLDPGCDFERWARRATQGTKPTVYAHVAREAAYPDRLALQYWLYYPFNDWNNNHEGDWEMIQLVFGTGNVADALATEPLEVGYSQHEGAEKADWGDEKLDVVDGTHPVVYPATGSHAIFYDQALFLGRSAQEGVGCDDTNDADKELRPQALSIPSDAAAARSAFPWIAFEGRWGERRAAFLNGPTGPNLKTQWTHPITWSQGWREHSYAVPAGGVFGTSATDFFCDAVATGSSLIVRLADSPGWVLFFLGAVVLLVILLARRTSWRPSTPLRVARRRSWGQTLTAAWRMYASRPLLFLGIGLVTIPIAVVVTLAQSALFRASGIAGVSLDGEGGGLRVAIGVGIGTVLTLMGLALVQAASVRAVTEIDARREIGLRRAYSLSLDSIGPLLGALAIAVAVVTVLSFSIFLIPVAIWLVVRWALLVPAIELEGRSWRQALRRSGQLVRRQWLKVGTLVVAAALISIVAGPFIGALLLFVPGAPVELVNMVAGLVYAVAMPFVGLTTTYVYYDTFVRERLDQTTAPAGELPAEASLN